jgi:uncharacterized protein
MPDQTDQRRELCGPLAERYRSERPRRILALDGGGIRGVITLGVLQSLDQQLADATGRGRSSVCATSSTSSPAPLYGERARQDAQERLRRGHRPRPERLGCLLIMVMRDTTTDSAWPVSSGPSAKYNDPQRTDCNLRIPLWKLVRASTAAAVFYPSEVIKWDPHDESNWFVFVDGGTTPYNNPAFLLYRMAVTPAYRLRWKTGERNLLVSVGTGSAPAVGVTADDPDTNIASAAINILSGADDAGLRRPGHQLPNDRSLQFRRRH